LKPKEIIIKTIENTFEAVTKANLSNVKHPTNANLTAVELLPVFPDFENWPSKYQLVVFDGDPIGSKQDKVTA
jgi:RNA polymerase II-associated factor 1